MCRHARAVHAVLSHQAAVAAQAVHNVTEFEDLDAAHNASNPPLVIPPLPDDATTMDIIRYAALCVWRKPCLRPVQECAVHKLVYDPVSEGKLLVIDRTGGGKSLILQLSGIIVGGIVFVLVPLLSLTANNISKIRRAVQDYGLVEVHHLDETQNDELVQDVIPKMETLGLDSSTTVFLFSSPKVLREALLRAHQRKILRLVAIDEAHLHTMRGRTFRDSIRIIMDVLNNNQTGDEMWKTFRGM